MATKRGKRPTKKIKTLKSRSVRAGKGKAIRGGSLSAAVMWGPTQEIQNKSIKIS